MEPSLVNWKDFCLKNMIGSERGVAEGVFLGNIPNGPRLRDVKGFLVRDWRMGPGLVNWKGTWSESVNGGELGA